MRSAVVKYDKLRKQYVVEVYTIATQRLITTKHAKSREAVSRILTSWNATANAIDLTGGEGPA